MRALNAYLSEILYLILASLTMLFTWETFVAPSAGFSISIWAWAGLLVSRRLWRYFKASDIPNPEDLALTIGAKALALTATWVMLLTLWGAMVLFNGG